MRLLKPKIVCCLLAVIWLAAFGCRKKLKTDNEITPIDYIKDWWMGEPPNIAADTTTEIKLPQYVKDFMLFKVGTYWVYKEKNSGAIDSVWVTKEPFDQFFTISQPNSNGKQKFEYLECYVRSSYYNCYYTYTCSAGLSEFPKGTYFHKIRRNKRDSLNNPINYDLAPTCMILPYLKGKKTYHSPISGGSIYDSIMDIDFFYSIKINVNAFSNVILALDSKNYNENEATKYFFAKNVGLVKLEYLNSNKIWELIKYNIVQYGLDYLTN